MDRLMSERTFVTRDSREYATKDREQSRGKEGRR